MLEPLLRTLDVYVLRRGSGSPVPVSLGLAAESDPVWSPDGTTLLFRSSRGGQPNLYTRRVGVLGAPETLVEDSPGSEVPSDWTAAGEMLFSAASDTRPDTDVFRRAPGGAVAPALADGFNQSDARISPDGGLVAYVSDESGQPEVYVTRLAATKGPRRQRRVGKRLPGRRSRGRAGTHARQSGGRLAPAMGGPVAVFHARRRRDPASGPSDGR